MRDSKAYNPPLLFLVGLLTFCLGVIAAIFGAVDKTRSATGSWLGPILAWTAVTALVATVMAAALQGARCLRPKDAPPPTWLVYAAVVVPVISGVFIVIACLRLGAKIAGTDSWRSALWAIFGA